MYLIRCVFLVLSILANWRTWAQPVVYNQETTKGLIGSKVTAIFEDSLKRFWYGTDKGICRLDSNSVTWNFYTYGFENGIITKMLQGKDGSIWATTHGDYVARYLPSVNNWVKYAKPNGPLGPMVKGMGMDTLGNIWFATYGFGVSKFDGYSWIHFQNTDGLASNLVYCAFVDKKNNKWFGTSLGLSKLNDSSWITYTSSDGLPSNKVTAIGEQANGNLWFGTMNGLSRFDGNNWVNFDTTDGLSANLIYSILIDKTDKVWITTSNGVSEFNGVFWTNYQKGTGLIHNESLTIFHASDSSYYVGHPKLGVSVLKNEELNKVVHFGGLPYAKITAFAEDKQGNYWIGSDSYSGGVSMYNGKYWEFHNHESGLIDNRVKYLLCDSSGVIWIATMGGIAKYEGNEWITFSQADGVNGSNFLFIFQDSKQNIWFGSDEGVTKFDGALFTNFNESHGLGGTYFSSIIEGDSGNIWCANYDGIYIQDGDRFYKKSINSNISYLSRLFKARSGQIWLIGGTKLYMHSSGLFYPILENVYCYGLNESQQGELLVSGSGVIYGFKDHWVTYGGFPKLTYNGFLDLFLDRAGNYWIANYYSIIKVAPEDLITGLYEKFKFREDQQLSIFPNPAMHQITVISSFLANTTGNLKIYNIEGKVVLEKSDINLIPGENVSKINIQPLSHGIYFLKLTAKNELRSSKFIVSH